MYLSLYSIGSQKHSCLRWAVYVASQYGLFHLKKEQTLRYLLNYFRNILRKEFHQKRERSLAFHWHILIHNLRNTSQLLIATYHSV